jgi:predicted DNA-binding transcriptional regulator AlpA
MQDDDNFPELPETGFVRLSKILAPRGPIPVSKSTWWAGVRAGRFPKPVKLGPRITAWRVEDIRRLIATGAAELCRQQHDSMGHPPPIKGGAQ